MIKFKAGVWAIAVLLGLSGIAQAAELSDIRNYRDYSPGFASAGQPSAEQFELLSQNGFERVIYIAFNNSRGAVENEDQLVKELGMDYVQVPVIWDAPTRSDFYAFAGAMQKEPEKKTLLHCQANYRASAFAFLYRVIYQGVDVAQAKADMNTVWKPDGAWKQLVFEILEENGFSPDCDGCDWTSGD